MKVEGYAIATITSDCPAIVRSPITNSNEVILSGSPHVAGTGPPRTAATCRATITLDNGTEIPIVVHATVPVENSCCTGSLRTLFTTTFETIIIKAPPGYMPRDAGADASDAQADG